MNQIQKEVLPQSSQKERQMLCFEQMKPEDLDQVMEIEEEAFSDPWSRRSFLDSIEDGNYRCMAAFLTCPDGSRLLAGYWIWLRSFEEADLMNIAVRRDQRGTGIGKALMENMLLMGERMGIRDFTLEVRRSNEQALRLYRSFGFLEEGVRKNYYSVPREDALILWRRSGQLV